LGVKTKKKTTNKKLVKTGRADCWGGEKWVYGDKKGPTKKEKDERNRPTLQGRSR